MLVLNDPPALSGLRIHTPNTLAHTHTASPRLVPVPGSTSQEGH